MTSAVIPFAIALLVAFVFMHRFRMYLWRRACRGGAESIYSDLLATFSGPHEYRAKRREETAGIDWSEYDGVRLKMQTRGFHHLGGMEDVTMGRAKPQSPNFLELYSGLGGTVMVATYNAYGVHVVDCMSETPDGRLLLTTNAELNKLLPPPNWRVETLSSRTTCGELLDLHLSRLAALRGTERGTQFIPIRSLEDAMASAVRCSGASSEHRRSIGLLTREELDALTSPGQESAAERVWLEFCRIREERHAA
jgi:hypothetical protein